MPIYGYAPSTIPCRLSLAVTSVKSEVNVGVERAAMTHQQSCVADDAQLLGPLAQPLLPPEEGADAGVLHQLDGGLAGRPLVLRRPRLALGDLLFVVGLVGAADRVSIVWWTQDAQEGEKHRASVGGSGERERKWGGG